MCVLDNIPESGKGKSIDSVVKKVASELGLEYWQYAVIYGMIYKMIGVGWVHEKNNRITRIPITTILSNMIRTKRKSKTNIFCNNVSCRYNVKNKCIFGKYYVLSCDRRR